MNICPDLEQLREYVCGDLDSTDIDRHLDGCPTCRQAIETLDDAADLGRLLRPSANDPVEDPLLQHLTARAKGMGCGEPAQGQLLGEYELLEPIARGGMGWVFRARHRRMNRVVAIKTIAPALNGQFEAAARFQREVEAIGRLSHPHIVAAHDAFDHQGGRFLVMEYVPGCSLDELIRRKGPLPVPLAIDFILQAARGLTHAHAAGIVHRDVKPGNLLLAPSASHELNGSAPAGTVKVLDLGLARTISQPAGDLTGGSVVMGTAAYMAPEQALDPRSADARADVYSLGCTLHYLLTGEAPYCRDSLLATLLAHRDEPVPSLRTARPDCPPALGELFRAMLAKRPQDRPASMIEVIAHLERIQSGKSVQGARRRRSLVAVGALAATVLVAFLACPGTPAPADPAPGQRLAAPAPREPSKKSSPEIAMVKIEPGKFWMGAGEAERDAQEEERPRHKIHITRPFLLGKFEVTQEQFQEVMGSNPSTFSERGRSKEAARGVDTKRHPVESISWLGAIAFCNCLSEKEGLESYYRVEKSAVTIRGGSGYRLPTEAEWEYACRAGSLMRWSHGEEVKELEAHAWFLGNAQLKTHPVGTKLPNAWGLHDMHGNVPEWCWDRYDARYYHKSKGADPAGSGQGTARVYRGGGWDSQASQVRSAARNTLGTAYSVLTQIGLRVARDVER